MDLEHAHVPTGDGVYLHCVLAGPVDATPLVAVHGGPDWDHSYLLDPLIRLGHRRLVLPDLRGCGRSSPGPCSFAAAARDLARLIRHLRLERPDLLGFSAGGQVVQRLVLDHPGPFGQVIMASSTLWPVTDADFGPWPERDRRRAAEAGVWSTPAPAAPDLVRRAALAGAPANVWRRDRIVPYRRMLERVRWSAHWLRALRAGRLDSPRPADGPRRLAEADAAWLFLHGRQDMVFPAHMAERAAALLPRSRAVVLDGAGHMAHVDRPEAWLDAVEDFLSGRAQASGAA
ncbi:alpha/beta hydrolase [Nocardiopsis sp. HNM0947]|uniref:Alpha/beta hydrolase n=1 Tax=Nocardiopsis coralli TaxID=2772213 RepID=A0ABR9P134_9ACTN|nr:alpha/beta hydrolase [Nocardiopsis coralli]MBE2997566.1 alpha/beta hydrolase [Nocardiopsis coralli]